MDDSIISRTGNSKILMGPANFAEMFPTWEAFRDAFAASGVPTDILTNPSGYEKLGAPLNAATLLKNTTAALVGLDGSAVPDDMLYALAWKAFKGTNLIALTVLDADGVPLDGVKLSGVAGLDGSELITDGGGAVRIPITANLNVTLTTDYLDIQRTVTQAIVYDADKFLQTITVTMPYVDTSEILYVAVSGNYRVRKRRNALCCAVGGGQGGYNGAGGSVGGSPPPGGRGGNGGTVTGKKANQEFTLIPGTLYECSVAAGGSPGGGLGGETSFATLSSGGGTAATAPLMDESLLNRYGSGVGGRGGDGGGASNNGGNGSAGTGNSGGGGAGGAGGRSSGTGYTGSGGSGGPYGGNKGEGTGQSTTNSRGGFGYNGGAGGYGGCGGGGGGGGGSGNGAGSGGIGGRGGQGVVLIQFLEEEETV